MTRARPSLPLLIAVAVSSLSCGAAKAASPVAREPSAEHAKCLAEARLGPPVERLRTEVYPLPPARDLLADRIETLRARQTMIERGWVGDIAHGRLTALSVDVDAGTVTATGDSHGLAPIVILLGGCVLFPDDPSDVAVLYLRNRSAAELASIHLQDVELRADLPTNGVVFRGTHEAVQRAWIEVAERDCQ